MKFLAKHWPAIPVAMVVAMVLGTAAWDIAQAQVRSAKVSWAAVTTATDGATLTGVTYHLYQGVRGGAYAKIDSNIAGLTRTVTTGLPAGEVCFKVSAQTVTNPEGGLSPEGCKSFPNNAPAGTPAAPTVE